MATILHMQATMRTIFRQILMRTLMRVLDDVDVDELRKCPLLVKRNKLTLNITKTEFMFIGSRQRLSTLTISPTFAINNFSVTRVSTAKSLGVTIDENLDWDSHIEFLIKKVSSSVGVIKQVIDVIYSPTDLTPNISSSNTPSFQLL